VVQGREEAARDYPNRRRSAKGRRLTSRLSFSLLAPATRETSCSWMTPALAASSATRGEVCGGCVTHESMTSAAATTWVAAVKRWKRSALPLFLIQDLLYMFGADHDKLLPWSPAASVPTNSSASVQPGFSPSSTSASLSRCVLIYSSTKNIFCALVVFKRSADFDTLQYYKSFFYMTS
jgi:hypothetical protein